jgi:hypothetical protein
VDPQNPATKKNISIVFLKTIFVCHRMGTSVFAGFFFLLRSNSVVQSGTKGDN